MSVGEMSEETVRLIHSDRAGFCFRRPAVGGEVVKKRSHNTATKVTQSE